MVEMALVFVPTMFLLVGTFEVGRAMWTHHALSAAVKRGARFAIVHGARCADASAACQATVADISRVIQQASLGLEKNRMKLTLAAGPQTVTCASLSTCLSDSTVWPVSPDNAVGLPLTISGTYSFDSVVFSWWPGQARISFRLGAKSSEVIQF